jgi:adenine-specific DNA-methyltransferase
LERDHWGNWVVNRKYNAAMLTEALCKLEGFRYAPSSEHFWQQGRSTERDFLFATTQTLDARQLEWLSSEVGDDRSLLILCQAWLADVDRWPNLTVKKIPNAVVRRCEFGRDDYSLAVSSLPPREPSHSPDAEQSQFPPAIKRAKEGKRASSAQTSLLDDDAEGSGT